MRTLAQIEGWVLALVDTVAKGGKVEDSRVELKRQWPDPTKAARRIAGHANAAGGEEILWVIGLDEVNGVAPFPQVDLSTWLPQVTREFDGVAPPIRDVIVPVGGSSVVALAIDTSRAPFVVRNLSYGIAGVTAQLEVPWREGTSIRSAKREDLVRLLVPDAVPPSVEVVSGRVLSQVSKPLPESKHVKIPSVLLEEHITWTLGVELYVLPNSRDRVVFPLHRAKLIWKDATGTTWRTASTLAFVKLDLFVRESRHPSRTVISTPTEAVIDGPGLLDVSGRLVEPVCPRPNGPMEVVVMLYPGSSHRAVSASATYQPTADHENGMFWSVRDS